MWKHKSQRTAVPPLTEAGKVELLNNLNAKSKTFIDLKQDKFTFVDHSYNFSQNDSFIC